MTRITSSTYRSDLVTVYRHSTDLCSTENETSHAEKPQNGAPAVNTFSVIRCFVYNIEELDKEIQLFRREKYLKEKNKKEKKKTIISWRQVVSTEPRPPRIYNKQKVSKKKKGYRLFVFSFF